MTARRLLACALCALSVSPCVAAQEKQRAAASDVAEVPARELRAGKDEHKRYFLIGPRTEKAPVRGYKLLLVLPGGDGGADFHPFVKRIAKHATGDDYLVAQLVAPQWDEKQAEVLVWPTAKRKWKGMKFSTEDFVDAVIRDVASRHAIDERHVFTLSWSSGGPAAYAVSLQRKPRVTGSLIAMSVFHRGALPSLRRAKRRAYYLLHSPDDEVCKYSFAELAEKQLRKRGAKVELATYPGGHGWRGNVYGNIAKGLRWLEKNHAAPPE